MEANNKMGFIKELAGQLKPWQVPDHPEIRRQIADVYNAIHKEGGEAFVEREAHYIVDAIIDDEKKWNVSPHSVYLAFLELAVENLSLRPGAQALCYLLFRSVKYSSYDNKTQKVVERWENRCYIAITGYGEIYCRQRDGQIRHCDSPTIVYEGDEFKYSEEDGRKKVTYSLDLDHDVSRPKACFMKITRTDGTTDYAILLREAWERLAGYSLKQNERTSRDKAAARPNALYLSGPGGSIDPGFLIAKCVKQAFKNYPKRRIGQNTMMMADLPDEEETMAQEPQSRIPESFAPPADTSTGVTVDPASSATSSDDDGTW